MSTILDAIRKLPHVAHVDDERSAGNSIIVSLATGWCFQAEPGCGVRGFDTVAEAKTGTSRRSVYKIANEVQINLAGSKVSGPADKSKGY